jgi:hypothetical protein
MWPTIERWSWIAGIVGALVGVATLVQSRQDRKRSMRDWQAQAELQTALLKMVHKLTGEAARDQSQPSDKPNELLDHESPTTLRQRAESLAEAANKLERRSRRRLRTGTASLGFALFAGAVAVLIRPTTIKDPITYILANMYKVLTAGIGLPPNVAWIISAASLGIIFAIIIAPLQIYNIRDARYERAYALPIRVIQQKYDNDRQRQAQELRLLENVAGFSVGSSFLRGYVIWMAVTAALPNVPHFESELELFGAPLTGSHTSGIVAPMMDGLAITLPLAALITLARLHINASKLRIKLHTYVSSFKNPEHASTAIDLILALILVLSIYLGRTSDLLAIGGYYAITMPLVVICARKPVVVNRAIMRKWAGDGSDNQALIEEKK